MQCLTPQGTPVEIIGAERIHPKLGGMAEKMINFPNVEDDRPCEYQKLKRVIFDVTGNPAGATGCWVNGDLTINVRQCFASGVALSEDREDSNVLATAWHMVLATFFHELFHVWVGSHPRLAFDDIKLEDDAADEFAFKQVPMFGMNYDTEMPPWREMGIMTEMMEELLNDKFEADPDSSWLRAQKRMLKEGIIIVSKEGNEIVTFREYLRLLSGYPLKNELRWDEPALVSWSNDPSNIKLDTPKPPKPAAVFTPGAAGAPPAPPTTAADAAPAAPNPQPVPSPPAATTPPPPQTSVPTPPASTDAQAGPEIVYDEDSPPEPDMSEYETREEVYHAYEPIRPPQNLTNHGIPMDEMISSIQAIYVRLAYVMFDKCQFNGGGVFANPAGVLDPVSIADIPHATELIESCETVNQLGQKTHMKCDGVVKGTVFAKKGLPAYILYLNINGNVHKRTLVAQNPNTQSKPAIQARNGAKIVWVIDADMSDQDVAKRRAAGQKASKFIAKITDGQYVTLR